jgi:large repetitive protein
LYGDTAGGGTGNIGCVACGVLYSLDMGLGPFVSLVNWFGKTEQTVEILGQGLTGTTKVSFNGTQAIFNVVSGTYMTATVPAGATTGFVTVTTPGGARKSSRKFLVLPTIVSFDPPSGPVGTSVTITGTSVTQTQGVGFGDHVPAQFTVNSDTTVTAIVPLGAKTGPVGVKTPGGTAISKGTFTVTP